MVDGYTWTRVPGTDVEGQVLTDRPGSAALPDPGRRNLGEEVTQSEEPGLVEKNYTHGPVNLALTVNPANRQATLEVTVFGDVTASATVQEGRPSDKIVSHQLPGGNLTLRLEAHKVSITGMLQDGPVNHEVALP